MESQTPSGPPETAPETLREQPASEHFGVSPYLEASGHMMPVERPRHRAGTDESAEVAHLRTGSQPLNGKRSLRGQASHGRLDADVRHDGVGAIIAERTETTGVHAPTRREVGDELPANITSPKLPGRVKTPSYRYYAGFSEQFVREILEASHLGPDALILDPWNGSGTTTRVAAELGMRAIGFDLNPAMAVVAKARLADRDEAQAAARLLASFTGVRPRSLTLKHDPLLAWFDKHSASLIRGIEMCFRERDCSPSHAIDVDALSVKQAYLYTALFLTVRGLIRPFVATNPTWVRTLKPSEDSLHVNWETIRLNLIASAVLLQTDVFAEPALRSRVEIGVGNSTSLPASMPEASLVLTSPPYCTRIDYAVATRPELSVLGISLHSQNHLRRLLLGATTVPTEVNIDSTKLCPASLSLLRDVWSHSTKASRTYYFKWLAEYLVGYSESLTEITRRTTSDAALVLVVQGSCYKDVRIDLPMITKELLDTQGWVLLRTYSFISPVTMAGVNPRSRAYRTDFSATEQVLVFSKRR